MSPSGDDDRLPLPQVTLCAVDTVSTPLAARALTLCRRGCAFGDSLLLAAEPADYGGRFEPIAPLASRRAYSEFVLGQLRRYLATPFVLLVQWDGYIVDPRRWSEAFLEYDYIGAPWHWHGDAHEVGNGGFSLRSRRLMELAAGPDLPDPGDQPEDHYICRTLRPMLEARHGIRFAPRAVAERFAYECSHPDAPTFGFHGLYNMWRHVPDHEMPAIVDGLAGYVIPSPEYAQLLRMYYILRKFGPLFALYRRLRRVMSAGEITRHLTRQFDNGPQALMCQDLCERHLEEG